MADLRAPIEKGWKRETVIRGLTKNGQIRGDVYYYAPGNQSKLKHIGQVQTVSAHRFLIKIHDGETKNVYFIHY